MFDLTPIVTSIITLSFVLITSFLVPYLNKKLSAEKRDELVQLANIAVHAAEQLYKSGMIRAEERKEYVEKFLYDRGMKLDMDEVESIIESCVFYLPKDKKVQDTRTE